MKLLMRILLTLALLLGIAGEVWSADFQKGWRAYLKRDYATALHEWIPVAEQGNAQAQFYLGRMYEYGVYGGAVTRNIATAFKWYRLAGEQGFLDAQYRLGVMYEYGKGVSQDDKTAVNWYRLAAKQGHASARRDVVRLETKVAEHKPSPTVTAEKNPSPSSGNFQKGLDAFEKRDYATALREWRPLAEQGNAVAQTKLAFMYLSGSGVPKDNETAVKWLQLAADQGDVLGQVGLGGLYLVGHGVPKDYAIAAKWFRLAAEQKDSFAQRSLGRMYAKGLGVPQDDETSVKWYRLAANQGDANAQINLGWSYQKGFGVSKNNETAAKWYRRAAEQGDAGAQNNLGTLYKEGQGVQQDYETAVKWYRLAAKQGQAVAEKNLGTMYQNGFGVPQDDEIAVKWYRLAAEQGDASSQNDLGTMYQNGFGVPQDDETAVKWYRLAAKQGNELGKINLKRIQRKVSEKEHRGEVARRNSKHEFDRQQRLELARRIQEALQVLGLYAGKLDGVVGVKTKAAIRRWQKRNGLPDTVDVDQDQLAKLEQEATTRRAKKQTEQAIPTKLISTEAPERPDDIAVIIANSNYKKYGKDIPNVTPAYNDATNIKRYFMQTLGVREGNIIYLKDATGAQMASVFGSQNDHRGKLFNWIKPNVSKVYIYYAGHGAPAGDQRTAYLVPSDAESETVQLTGYPLKQLYHNIGKLPASSITVILEACFSGQSQGGYLSVRTSGITVAPAMPNIPDRLTVISAGAANQVASWEKDQSQSLFTKYFLKAMSGDGDKKPHGNGNGIVSLKELKSYLDTEMTYLARRYYGRVQNAQITVDGRRVLASN
jgi:uncharacterized protein